MHITRPSLAATINKSIIPEREAGGAKRRPGGIAPQYALLLDMCSLTLDHGVSWFGPPDPETITQVGMNGQCYKDSYA